MFWMSGMHARAVALAGAAVAGAALTRSALLIAIVWICGSAAVAQTLPERLERISVHGPSLVGNLEGDDPNRMVSVYLPPSYHSQRRRRYPVLYVLHGYTDSDDRWFGLRGEHFVNLPRAIDAAYEDGAAEMIVVMPNAFTKYQGSMYSSSATIGDWEAFVARDLVAYIDGHYRTITSRASRGLAGHSMGGYGTLRIGMKHPGVFSSLYSLSPCCLGPNLDPPAEQLARADSVSSDAELADADFGTKAMLASAAAWSPNPERPPRYFDLPIENGERRDDVVAAWAANAPLAMIHQYVPSLRTFEAIAVDAGDEDRGIAATVVELNSILDGYQVDHVFEIYDGNHVNRIEERFRTQVMPFFSEHLDRPR
jgi:S-formylglutathione hydrolase